MNRCYLLVALLAASCIDDPTTDNPVSVTVPQTTAAADGATVIPLTVTADTDGEVTLTASTGTFVTAAAPGSGAFATAMVSPARGSTTIGYRTGLDVGTAEITATAGSGSAIFTFTLPLTLMPSTPAGLALTADRTSIPADGVSFVTLKAEGTIAAPAAISHGTPVRFGVCCANASDQPITCGAGDLPFVVPSSATIDDGHSASVEAVTRRIVATTGSGSGSGSATQGIDAFLVASFADGSDAVSCPPPASPLTSQIEVVLTPQ